MKEQSSVLGLATVRRNRGITLEEIAEQTKISVRALEAIEHGDFRKLPGGIYTTSYIRQYARFIDYPADDILEYFRRLMAGETPNPRSDRKENVSGLRPASTPAGS